MIRAVGDRAVVERSGEVLLAGPRGVITRWSRDVRSQDGAWRNGEVVDVAVRAEPPRLVLSRRSRGHGSVGLEMIDVVTGASEARLEQGLHSVVCISPTGALVCNGAAGLALVDEDGEVTLLERGGEPALEGRCDRDGRAALCRRLAAPGEGTVTRVDVAGRRLAWTRPADVQDFVADDALERGAFLVRDDEHRRLELWELEGGEPVALLTDDDIDDDHGPWGVFADRRFTTLVAPHHHGALDLYDARGPIRRPAATVDVRGIVVDVDVDAGLVLARTSIPRARRLFDLGGNLLCELASAPHACFSRGGAFALVDGAVHELCRGGPRLVEGPTGLVELAPHPRGLIALDADDRSHVFDVEASA